MRITPILAAIAIVVSPFVLVSSADAPTPHVDAGSSLRATVGASFSLNGFVEDMPGATTLWTAPAGCTLSSATSLDAIATCSEAGKKSFTFTATDGSRSASDTVAIAVTGGATSTSLLADAYGETLVGAAGLHVLPVDDVPFTVPEGTQQITATLTWNFSGDDFDFTLLHGEDFYRATSTDTSQEVLTLDDPAPGEWTAAIEPWTAYLNEWHLVIVARVGSAFDAELPVVRAPAWAGDVGGVARLVANATGGSGDVTLAWETDPGSRRFDDATGSVAETLFAGTSHAFVRATDAEGYEVTAKVILDEAGAFARPLTVVAVLDNGFSVYHNDFLAAKHPWNVDEDLTNDLDLARHPAALVDGYPAADPLLLTLPTADSDPSDALRALDAPVWESMLLSNASALNLYWIPGTKVIGAMRFGPSFAAPNDAHGSASASVAVGNVHGSCPECLVVLLAGNAPEALEWVAAQPWIDVVTNSYGHGSLVQSATLGLTRDNIYLESPLAATKTASEEGQVIVFSAGNGFANAFDAPMFTYWSSEKGPDWMVTVGAVSPQSEQTASGAGKPVDISSIGETYPSSGGTTADGAGVHGGTSNAAPVTAGYFAKVIQAARELLGDDSAGHAGGVVAQGAPVACGAALPSCALGDGVLTRRELQDLVYHNVLPSPQDLSEPVHVGPLGYIPFVTVPTTEHAYYYQGHGVLTGRLRGDAEYASEWTRMVDVAVGALAAYDRPAGETAWFVTDSKCRQALWGAWSGGYYTGQARTLDPAADPLAFAYDAWCSQIPAGSGAAAAPILAPAVHAI